jgi:hypothetical protein
MRSWTTAGGAVAGDVVDLQPHALLEVGRVEDHATSDQERRAQHGVAPAIHRGVFAARVARLGKELLAHPVRLDHLGIERRAETPGEAALAGAWRADEHDQERVRHRAPV